VSSLPAGFLVNSPERCFEVGGDPDGHRYFISADSGEIYVWRHDPDEVTQIDVMPFSIGELIEWSLRRDSAYPGDRRWSTFEEIGASTKIDIKGGAGSAIRLPPTRSLVFGHSREYPFVRICERLAVFGDFEEQFESDQVLALLQPTRSFLVEMTHQLRGRRCQLHLVANEALVSDAIFVEQTCQLDAWLRVEGFCDVDDPAVMMPEE